MKKVVLLTAALVLPFSTMAAETSNAKPLEFSSVEKAKGKYYDLLYKILRTQAVESTDNMDSRFRSLDYTMNFQPLFKIRGKAEGIELKVKTLNARRKLLDEQNDPVGLVATYHYYDSLLRDNTLFYIIVHNHMREYPSEYKSQLEGYQSLLDDRKYTNSDSDVKNAMDRLKTSVLSEDDITLLLFTAGPVLEKMVQANQYKSSQFSKSSQISSYLNMFNLEELSYTGALIGSDLETLFQKNTDKNSDFYDSSMARLEKYNFYLSNHKLAGK